MVEPAGLGGGDPLASGKSCRSEHSDTSSRAAGHQTAAPPPPPLSRLVRRSVLVSRPEFERLQAAEVEKRQQTWRRRRSYYACLCRVPVLHPTSPFYAWWALLMLLLDLTYTAVVCPLTVAFAPRTALVSWAFIVDFAAGLLFTVDIVLNLSVGYIVQHGVQQRVVMRRGAIARQYMTRGPFAVDALSSVAWFAQAVVLVMGWAGSDPQNSIELAHALRVARILRILRVLRLLKFLYLNNTAGNWRVLGLRPHTMHILQLLYVAVVIVNFCGCMWAFTARENGFEGSWMTRYGPFIARYGGGLGEPLTAAQVADISVWVQWLASFYWASTTILTVGYGDIVPWTPLETGVCICVQLLGICFFGALLSSIATLIQRASKAARRGQALQDKLDGIEKFMRQQRVARDVRKRVKLYYTDVWLEQQDGLDVGAFFGELPHTLRTVQDPGALRALAARLEPLQLPPGFTLAEEGEEAAACWILQEGQVCEITRRELDGQEEEEEVDGPALLGEAALLGPALGYHHSTLRTVTRCTLWRLDAGGFAAALRMRPQAMESIRAVLLHESSSPRAPPPGDMPLKLVNSSGKHSSGDGGGGGEVQLFVDARARSNAAPSSVVVEAQAAPRAGRATGDSTTDGEEGLNVRWVVEGSGGGSGRGDRFGRPRTISL